MQDWTPRAHYTAEDLVEIKRHVHPVEFQDLLAVAVQVPRDLVEGDELAHPVGELAIFAILFNVGVQDSDPLVCGGVRAGEDVEPALVVAGLEEASMLPGLGPPHHSLRAYTGTSSTAAGACG